MHCADVFEMTDLEQEFTKFKNAFNDEKCFRFALRPFEFPEEMDEHETNLFIPCQAVRFVQRYKGKHFKIQ